MTGSGSNTPNMKKPMHRALAFVVGVWAVSVSATAEPAVLDKLEAFLVSSRDGKLSEDLLLTKPALWNQVIAADGARADDVLLVAHFKTKLNAEKIDRPSIMITDTDGEAIFAMNHFDLTFVGEEDASKAFLLPDVTCRHLKIVITSGTQKWNNEIPFRCGE